MNFNDMFLTLIIAIPFVLKLMACIVIIVKINIILFISSNSGIMRLASPVISASVQCDNCTTSNLLSPVEVTFTHLPYDVVGEVY